MSQALNYAEISPSLPDLDSSTAFLASLSDRVLNLVEEYLYNLGLYRLLASLFVRTFLPWMYILIRGST